MVLCISSCNFSGCPLNLTLNGNPDSFGIYQANNWIVSTSKINNATATNNSVIYYAGDAYILLDTGFEANGTVHFIADVFDSDLVD